MEGFKKFSAEAGTLFTRAKQYTEEKLGSAEKTEYDAHFENLMQRAERTRRWTELIVQQTETVLQPNPNARIEDYVMEKVDRKRSDRVTNPEILGQTMVDAGNDIGPGTAYGAALVKCGQVQQKLGVAEKELISTSIHNYLQPLKNFLDGDMKTINKERKLLENKRLDLDAAKSKLRKTKSDESKAKVTPGDIEKSEEELRVAQSEFDKQYEITKLLLEGVSNAHANHLRCLQDFVEVQHAYFVQCTGLIADLQKQLTSLPGAGNHSNSVNISSAPSAPPKFHDRAPTGTRRARVLYDYDAADLSELSLLADEIITVYSLPGMDSDWMMGERGNQKGKVPVTFLELLD
ncbi:endophilin-B1-like [Saccoglossus kowalevskii]|uniref:Endophilin-B1-like isoform X2 n=1 Tax=Saccoglossus kowalevskii TaxID=10224 RepID=A0ABM0MFH6_SACKO|nr:PREDICTED: endophilin-B1-like isoform X2 [Saccoglossus kowalevskii]